MRSTGSAHRLGPPARSTDSSHRLGPPESRRWIQGQGPNRGMGLGSATLRRQGLTGPGRPDPGKRWSHGGAGDVTRVKSVQPLVFRRVWVAIKSSQGSGRNGAGLSVMGNGAGASVLRRGAQPPGAQAQAFAASFSPAPLRRQSRDRCAPGPRRCDRTGPGGRGRGWRSGSRLGARGRCCR